ncbi:basic amino acid/polyamine antiporter [Propionimicrobium sp. PCR01-08-3]|uniref:basic amino acid/polyamine antiporter n=1 Tax=Propionimicrobium sp. PCR01-08-3 TaxID=3052086 RepID=UPI00255CDC37|nr:basic amino acid/polyamine antiporter [Propionimicrobium sp. PCR01-08-3]WIY83574.1 basic amino acid/polyamine antiporter [Propionimicrobium sp. PCR01-08-3]
MALTAGEQSPGTSQVADTVRLPVLVSLIIGSCVGSGIFAMPQNVANVASPGAAAIGWAITGVGMLCIAFVFQSLALRKPHLDSGVYSYVRAGLGDFVGFASGWGYWLASIIAQVGYATLFFSSLSYFVPVFDGSHPMLTAVFVSLLNWCIFAVLRRGVRQAAILNIVTTIAKLLPIAAFLVLVAFIGFHTEIFTADFWGRAATFGSDGTGTGASTSSLSTQVKGIMLFTTWAFIGIEGASAYSRRAKSKRDVSLATLLGYLLVFVLLLLVTFLSYGVAPRSEIAAMGDNSMAGVLELVVGPWGAALVSAGLCISVLGAYVSWQMLCAEPITLMAQDELLPARLGYVNSQGAPATAQSLSACVIQLFVVIFFVNEAAYTTMVQLATSLYLIPYLFASLYLFFLATRGSGIQHPDAGRKFNLDGPDVPRRTNLFHLIISAIGVVYALWLFYAADPKFVLLGMVLVVPGMIIYIVTRRRAGGRVFNPFEWFIAAIVTLAAIIAILLMVQGSLTL